MIDINYVVQTINEKLQSRGMKFILTTAPGKPTVALLEHHLDRKRDITISVHHQLLVVHYYGHRIAFPCKDPRQIGDLLNYIIDIVDNHILVVAQRLKNDKCRLHLVRFYFTPEGIDFTDRERRILESDKYAFAFYSAEVPKEAKLLAIATAITKLPLVHASLHFRTIREDDEEIAWHQQISSKVARAYLTRLLGIVFICLLVPLSLLILINFTSFLLLALALLVGLFLIAIPCYYQVQKTCYQISTRRVYIYYPRRLVVFNLEDITSYKARHMLFTKKYARVVVKDPTQKFTSRSNPLIVANPRIVIKALSVCQKENQRRLESENDKDSSE